METTISNVAVTMPCPAMHEPDRFRSLVDAIEDYAIFMLDPQGVITSWNSGAEKIKGYTAQEIIGRPFTRFYPPEEVQRGWPQEELRLAAARGRFEDEGWRLRKNGERFWANVVITSLRDEDGELYGYAKITRDLSERRRNEELLRQSEERFRLLVDSVDDHALCMLDPEGRIQSWNTGAESLTGYKSQEVLGRHFSLFYTAEGRAEDRPTRALQDALSTGRTSDEGWRVRKDGSVFCAAVTVTAVHDSEGRLQGFAQVTRDMTEQRRVLELETSARRISQFLAILGHELRNPLAPIRNAVTIMQMDPAFPSHLHPLRDIIGRQLTQMTRLVDDLLDVGRITSGKIVLRREKLVWQDVVRRSIEAIGPQMAEREHVLNVELPPQPIAVHGDPTRLQQVLQNLLNNAAKFTPRGGRIGVEVVLKDDMVLTRVTDNGRGIAADALGGVFDLFVQGEHEHHHAVDGGLGIGLALARILVELHGGTVRAESPGPGLGSTFTVGLALLQPEATKEDPQQPELAAGPAAFPVLVVDDNRDSAETMAALIEALGHPVKAVFDGRQAPEAARDMVPWLILLDLNMPGRTGYDVLADLRALPLSRRPFIAAMTGYGQETDRTRTADAGFDAHLTKPVEPKQLLQLLAVAAA